MESITEDFSIRVTHQQEWGSLVALDLFLEGAGGGLFFVSILLGSPLGQLLGLLLALLGVFVLLMELGRPERFWMVFSRPSSSWISRGALIIGVLIVGGTLYLLSLWKPLAWLPWSEGTTIGILLKATVALASFALMLYTGFALSSTVVIPSWNTGLLPLWALAHSLSSGGAILLFLTTVVNIPLQRMGLLQALQLSSLLSCLVVSLVFLLTRSSSGGKTAGWTLAQRRLTFLFFGGVIGVGLIVPLLGTTYVWSTNNGLETALLILGISAAARLTGDFSFRYFLLRIGFHDAVV